MKKLWLIFYLLYASDTGAQSVARPSAIGSGPMPGQLELRTATVWLQVSPAVKSVSVIYWKKDHPDSFGEKKYAGILTTVISGVRMTWVTVSGASRILKRN